MYEVMYAGLGLGHMPQYVLVDDVNKWRKEHLGKVRFIRARKVS